MKFKTTLIKTKEEEDAQLFVSASNEDDNVPLASDDEDEGQDEKAHSHLINDMKKISKRKKAEVAQDVRTSLGSGVAEVDTSSLLERLGTHSLKRTKKNSKFDSITKPLEKTVARRIKRKAGYEEMSMEVYKWSSLVNRNRLAEQVKFPLEQADVRIKTLDKVEGPKLRSPLEQEVYSLLQGANLVKEKHETEEEKATKRALSLQEVRERNQEMWRLKEMKRRYEEKARLQNKSKSKKHHRILRREKLKKQKAELAELEKRDPEAAMEMLKEMERGRVLERMSLRHKTSKWAHLQGFRATRDQNVMVALKENQRVHRELVTKVALNQEESEDEDDRKEIAEEILKKREAAIEAGTYDPLNPWTNNLSKESRGAQSSQEDPNDETYTNFKKFWEEVHSRKVKDQKILEELRKREEEIFEKQKEKDVTGNEKIEELDISRQENSKYQEEGEVKKQKTNQQDKKDKAKMEGTKKKSPKKCKQSKNKEKTNEETNKAEEGEKATEATCIDDMFDEAEVKIKKKVKRKLKKLGISTDNSETWVEVKRKKKSESKTSCQVAPTVTEEFDFTGKNDDTNIDEKRERVTTLEEIDTIPLDKAADKIQLAIDTLKKGTVAQGSDTTAQKTSALSSKKKAEVDPKKFLQVDSKKLITAMPDNVAQSGEGLDDDEDEEMEDAEDVIREAFADDYLIDEFKSDKAAAIEKSKPKTLSLALPGWGDWTGPNIQMSKRKVKRFRMRAPKAPPRKDSTIGNVIYNEEADVHDNLRKAMVSELPYPFKSVKDFEASVRAPVGRTFVPEKVHKKLTAPTVVTNMGTIIEPMTEDALLKHKNNRPSMGSSDTHKKKEPKSAGRQVRKGNKQVKRNFHRK